MPEQNFKPFQRVLVRDERDHPWRAAIFSFYTDTEDFPYAAIGSDYRRYCIPYEGNEQFCDTISSPTLPEQKFKFGDTVKVWNNGEEKETATFIHEQNNDFRYCVLLNKNNIAYFTYCEQLESDK